MGKPANRPETGRDEMGRMLPGTTLNPNGRPKVANEFRIKARAVVDELVLAAWESEVRSMGEEWMKASELLAAYAYGKPSQSIEVSGSTNPVAPGVDEMTKAEMLEAVRSGK